MPALLRRDRSFGWFIVSRLTGTIAASAPPFFTVYAMARYGVGPGEVAWLTAAASIGRLAGSILAGVAADALGHKVVHVCALLAEAAACAVALLGGGVAALFVAFVISAMAQSASFMTGMNLPWSWPHGAGWPPIWRRTAR